MWCPYGVSLMLAVWCLPFELGSWWRSMGAFQVLWAVKLRVRVAVPKLLPVHRPSPYHRALSRSLSQPSRTNLQLPHNIHHFHTVPLKMAQNWPVAPST
jgi:hypothetical protein